MSGGDLSARATSNGASMTSQTLKPSFTQSECKVKPSSSQLNAGNSKRTPMQSSQLKNTSS